MVQRETSSFSSRSLEDGTGQTCTRFLGIGTGGGGSAGFCAELRRTGATVGRGGESDGELPPVSLSPIRPGRITAIRLRILWLSPTRKGRAGTSSRDQRANGTRLPQLAGPGKARDAAISRSRSGAEVAQPESRQRVNPGGNSLQLTPKKMTDAMYPASPAAVQGREALYPCWPSVVPPGSTKTGNSSRRPTATTPGSASLATARCQTSDFAHHDDLVVALGAVPDLK